MKICSKCNSPNQNNAKMCNQCGTPLQDQIYPDIPNQDQQNPQIVIQQQPKKKSGCLLGFIITIIAVFTSLVVIGVVTSSVDSSKKKSNSIAENSSSLSPSKQNSGSIDSSKTNSESPEDSQESENPEEIVYNIGDTATINNWEITVSDFQIVDSINSDYGTLYYTPEESGNKYAQVFVTVSNTGNKNDTFLPLYAYGDDVNVKLLYGDSEFSSTWFSEKFDVHNSNIPPLSSQDGSIVFSIPSTVYDGQDSITLVFSSGKDSVAFQLR